MSEPPTDPKKCPPPHWVWWVRENFRWRFRTAPGLFIETFPRFNEAGECHFIETSIYCAGVKFGAGLSLEELERAENPRLLVNFHIDRIRVEMKDRRYILGIAN